MKTIKIAEIRIDGGTQPRSSISEELVAEYAEAIQDGATFPPVTVFHDGAAHWLGDGFHRYHAHRQAGLDGIQADVREGTRRDAILFSVGANNDHGLRRSNDDKHKAVLTLLRDAEWSAWSDREIARQCSVSRDLVASVRRAYLAEKPDGSPPDVRTVTRGGTTYQQKTAGIAEANAARATTPKQPAETPEGREKSAKAREQEEHEQAMADAAEGFDPLAELEIAHREIEMLNARIRAMSVDDTGKELAKQIEIRQGIESRLAQETTKVHELDRQLRRMGKVMEELRKLTGAESNSGIVPAVRALVRKAA